MTSFSKPVVYTAIIGPYDHLKEPTVVTPGWRYVCFTDQPLVSDTWLVLPVKVPPGLDRVRFARRLKIKPYELPHVLNSDVSLWVDASFQIACDLTAWCRARYAAPMTVVQHPMRSCVYREAEACVRNRRGDRAEILRQVAAYRQLGVPANGGLIASGVLLRETNDLAVRRLCDVWWETVALMSTRDQLGFAFAAWHHPIFHATRWDYRVAKDLIFAGHLKPPRHA